NPAAGALSPSSVTIEGGTGSTAAVFQPAGKGVTVLAVQQPRGWSIPASAPSIKAIVSEPGLSLTDQIRIGQDLQAGGLVGLGEVAPDEGVTITLTSDSPDLLLSTSATEIGSKCITLKVAPGDSRATYFLQALKGSGSATYAASATGYRSR